MDSKTISIGCASAFWGDTPLAVGQLLREPNLDYIVFDYLSEVTMTILAKMRSRDPLAGYAADFFTDVIEPHLEQILTRKIRLISNAGGLNPLALKEKILQLATQRGLSVKVACVTGDDLLADGVLPDEIRADSGRVHARQNLVSANAYLGAAPIVQALDEGAQIVLLGRSVDSALTLGALAHEFRAAWNNYDFLAQASLAGHILECGTQCCGGNFTDWKSVPKAEDVGFPIVRFQKSGNFTVTKPPQTGGLVNTDTVAEQILYEIGDPGSYLLPDVICDFRQVRLEQEREDVVAVSGARGGPPANEYKVCATFVDGHKIAATAYLGGIDALEKAQSVGATILRRCLEVLQTRGLAPYSETRVEALGGPTQALLRLSAAHVKTEALDVLAKEIAPASTSLAPGIANLLGGRPQSTPRVGLATFLIVKEKVKPMVILEKATAVKVAMHTEPVASQPLSRAANKSLSGSTVSVPLSRIAFARSGDKGNDVNIGVRARRPEQFQALCHALTAKVIAAHFAADFDGAPQVAVWELPGLHSLNFVLKDSLGGGGAYSLRVDPQGKAFAQRLLGLAIAFPEDLV